MAGPHAHPEDISEDSIPDRKRAALASRTITISTLVTVAIGFVEFIFWMVSANSMFLIEGAGNIVWLVPDIVMLLSLRVGSRKADRKMNFGYRRVETIFLLIFALGITVFVLGVIVRTLARGPEQFPTGYGPATVILAAVIIVVLLALGRYIRKTGKKLQSRLLLLDARVVELDAASAAVLLISGIFLVVAPSFVLIQMILTIIVALALLSYSIGEGVQAAKELVDANPSLQTMEQIEQIAQKSDGVRCVSEIRTRSFGGAIAVDLTIETSPDISVGEGHRIATGLEDRIRARVENIIDIRIRVHPQGAGQNHPSAE